jgi:hypothetical protein
MTEEIARGLLHAYRQTVEARLLIMRAYHLTNNEDAIVASGASRDEMEKVIRGLEEFIVAELLGEQN